MQCKEHIHFSCIYRLINWAQEINQNQNPESKWIRGGVCNKTISRDERFPSLLDMRGGRAGGGGGAGWGGVTDLACNMWPLSKWTETSCVVLKLCGKKLWSWVKWQLWRHLQNPEARTDVLKNEEDVFGFNYTLQGEQLLACNVI